MTTKELYDIAERHHVQVECLRLPENISFSLCLAGKDYIAIDPFALKNEADERERIAHELGHCETGSFYNRYSPLDLKEQHEERATRWAIQALVNETELLEAVEGGFQQRWELAEYFNLPEPFMEKVLRYYELKKPPLGPSHS